LPARQDALEEARNNAQGLSQTRWELLMEAMNHLLFPPKHPQYPIIEEIIWRWCQRALKGEVTSSEALTRIEQEAEWRLKVA